MIKDKKDSKTLEKRIKEKSKVTKEEWREYTKTVWSIPNTTHPLHPAVFPKEIPNRLIKLFSFWGESVLDPFAGTGVTGVSALELGRSAICVDQNRRYIKEITKNLASVNCLNKKSHFEVLHDDSRK